MLFHGDTPLCQNLVCLNVKEQKTILPDSNSWCKYNFDIEVKGHTEDRESTGQIYTCAKYGKKVSNNK